MIDLVMVSRLYNVLDEVKGVTLQGVAACQDSCDDVKTIHVEYLYRPQN